MRSSVSFLGYCAPVLLGASLLVTGCSKKRPEGEPDTRTTVTKKEVSVGGLFRASEETTVTEPIAAPEPKPRSRPQSGNLTAGDHDDLLNADLYAAYAGRFLQRSKLSLPFVDPRAQVAVKVVDSAGRPVPQARIEVGRKGAPLRLVSAADGMASFYPRFDGVAGSAQISVSSPLGTVRRTIQLGGKGAQAATIQLPGRTAPVAAMDLVLVLDATGSMDDEMSYLQAELETIIGRLKRETGNLDLRIGLIVYRDEGDDYVSKSFPLTGDVGSIRGALFDQEAGGGGDTPEAVDRALADAAKMQWRPNAVKALLFVADAPPHDDRMQASLDATLKLRSRGVQIIPVAASGVEDSAQYLMRTMAVLTRGRYVFLTDDSGVGNSHEEPDVACYVVTHLDGLIARLLTGIVEGRRIEPNPGEVIRTVGNYDRGRCRVDRPSQG